MSELRLHPAGAQESELPSDVRDLVVLVSRAHSRIRQAQHIVT